MTYPPIDGDPQDPHPAPAPGGAYGGPPAWGPPAQPAPGAGQPYPAQGYPGQPYPAQQYPAQQYPGQQYPGQEYPPPYAGGPYAQPYPGAYPQPYGAPHRHRLTAPGIGWALLATAALVGIGAVLPWARVFGYSVNGTDGDGVLTLVCAVVIGAAGLVIALGQGRLWASITATVFAVLVSLIGFIDLADVKGVVSDHAVIDGAVSVGSGLWLTVIAGVAGVVAAVTGIVRRR